MRLPTSYFVCLAPRQKGIFAEETEGNLDAAIKIYEQTGAEAAANRAVVAQAQYRLGVCYQKKGNKEQAIKILNEPVQQFPSDVTVTQKARGTLAELGATPPEAVSVRKIPLPDSLRRFAMWATDSNPGTTTEHRWFSALAVAAIRHHCDAMNVTLKSVPKRLHARLKEAARRNGRSLNTEAIAALEREYLPVRLDPQAFLSDLRQLGEKFPVAPALSPAELKAAINEGRA
ncbi:MAG: FitA-like ribbon-helix-helix domain-containing protein [Limisphaerales bacterium]